VRDVPDGPLGDQDCLAFFARITAGQSHELSNVLNVINELVGLELDILSRSEPDASADRTRLRDISDRIRAQIDRGGQIIREINRFAHSADVPRAVFDVKEALCRIAFLAERWTKLKKVRLTAEVPDETIALENSPFLFQRAIFLCIEAALLAANAERRIAVGFSLVSDGVEIVVTSADPVPRSREIETRIARLRSVVDGLGGELRACPDSRGGDRFVFFMARGGHPEFAGDPDTK